MPNNLVAEKEKKNSTHCASVVALACMSALWHNMCIANNKRQMERTMKIELDCAS